MERTVRPLETEHLLMSIILDSCDPQVGDVYTTKTLICVTHMLHSSIAFPNSKKLAEGNFVTEMINEHQK